MVQRHLLLAIRNDEQLNKLLASVTIAQGGVLSKIYHYKLLKPSNSMLSIHSFNKSSILAFLLLCIKAAA